MTTLTLIKHAPGAPGLRFLGLGPNSMPSKGIEKLQKLLDDHAFWAKKRSKKNIKKLLAGSKVVITLWRGKRIVGFGRATSDEIYRAVLWDIVVAEDLQGQGLGSLVVESLLESKYIKNVERIYLMTSNSIEFYQQLKFDLCKNQTLLIKSKN